MEETIGYEDLFSDEDLDSIDIGSWTEQLPHSVTVMQPPGDYAGNESRYELECDVCDYVGSADDHDQALALCGSSRTLRGGSGAGLERGVMTDDDKIFPDLSDLVIMLLASTLSGLRDRLRADGFDEASEFVADLGARCDRYIEDVEP